MAEAVILKEFKDCVVLGRDPDIHWKLNRGKSRNLDSLEGEMKKYDGKFKITLGGEHSEGGIIFSYWGYIEVDGDSYTLFGHLVGYSSEHNEPLKSLYGELIGRVNGENLKKRERGYKMANSITKTILEELVKP